VSFFIPDENIIEPDSDKILSLEIIVLKSQVATSQADLERALCLQRTIDILYHHNEITLKKTFSQKMSLLQKELAATKAELAETKKYNENLIILNQSMKKCLRESNKKIKQLQAEVDKNNLKQSKE
jgi:hypothetical protein